MTDRQRIMQHLHAANYADNDDDTDSDLDDFDESFAGTEECLDINGTFLLDDVDYTPGSCVNEFSECTDELEHNCSAECDRINEEDQMSAYEEDDCVSVCTEYSFVAPPHSPLSPSEVVGMDLDDTHVATISNFHTDSLTVASSTSLYANDDSVNSAEQIQSAESWKGFKVVGDNLDKNIRPSFQCFANKTNSLHYFHHYALLDRVDFSGYSEHIPNDPINLRRLLVSRSNVAKLENDAVVLFSRFVNSICMC